MLEEKLSAGERFDDQHGAGAGGTTWQVGGFGAIWAGDSAEQLAAALDLSTASSVGEQSAVADADQAFGQDVQKESAQELIRRNGHDLLLAAVSVVPPAE